MRRGIPWRRARDVDIPRRRGAVAAATRIFRGYAARPRPRRVAAPSRGRDVDRVHGKSAAGHLRSTIIGDVLANCLELRGHAVTRQNHVGDWGTQFGMLLEHLEDEGGAADADLGDLVAFYKAAKRRFDADASFKDRARERVVRLQAGDSETLESWRTLCGASRTEFDSIYERLNVAGLEEVGESFYNDRLAGIVEKLEAAGVAEASDGATVVFAEDDTERAKAPLIIRKTDGGFLYATTDLAACSYDGGVHLPV